MDARLEHQPRRRSIALPGRGGAVAALDFGPEGRPVDIVFSHANGFNAAAYRTILAPLAGDLRILAFDLRGHGASTLPTSLEGWPGWPGYAEDLRALLAAATSGPVILAGHSMGATSSLLAAVAEPARVRSLVLFEPVLYAGVAQGPPDWDSPLAQSARRRRDTFPDRAAAFEAYRGRGAFATWSDAQLADYVAAGFDDTADGQVTLACRPAWETANFVVHGYDPRAALEAVRRPTLILRGERGTTAAEADAWLQAAGAAATVRLEVVPGASHFLPMEHPERVRDALREAVLAPG